MLRPILFLDFDGVLHTKSPPRDLRFAANLLPIVIRYEFEVVISSTWREVYSLQELKGKLGRLGSHVIDCTPLISDDDSSQTGKRQAEIEKWLEANFRSDRLWAAIDDDRDGFRPSCKRLFLVDGTQGFNQVFAHEFIRWFEDLAEGSTNRKA